MIILSNVIIVFNYLLSLAIMDYQNDGIMGSHKACDLARNSCLWLFYAYSLTADPPIELSSQRSEINSHVDVLRPLHPLSMKDTQFQFNHLKSIIYKK